MENSSNPKDTAPTGLSPANQPDPVTAQATAAREGVSGLQVLQSTLAAALGVQSRKNRERDFKEGKASQFIIAGVLFTLIFIGVMITIVRTVLSGT